jgi:Amt family ammonium transporter
MIDTGNTAWMLTSTALVLFMTLPGLALFYGGLVQSKNVLSVLMHCIGIACLASVLWFVVAYSLTFSGSGSAIGDLTKALLANVARDSTHPAAATIPESVFIMFQMTFAIITPALIVGAYVERIKFSAVLLFSALWLLVVYAPVAHWVWGGGWLAAMGIKDFAGGIVVHTTAGVAALATAYALGKRRGFPNEVNPPHAPWMVMVGASMLWVGWFGFNAGSAVAANADAGMAMLATQLSAATASLVWMTLEWTRFGKPSMVGLVTGTIAGLATVTPASGFIGPLGGVILGAVGAVICYSAVNLVKRTLAVDDSLDVLAVHGFGGATGTILTAILATTAFGGTGLTLSVPEQLGVQVLGVAVAVVWSGAVSYALILLCRVTVGLRVDEDEEQEGLDQTAHGESAYRP